MGYAILNTFKTQGEADIFKEKYINEDGIDEDRVVIFYEAGFNPQKPYTVCMD